MTRKLTNWNLIRGFLEFEHLLVHKLTLFMIHHVWVQWALFAGLITGFFGAAATAWEGKSREATVNMNVFAVIATLATNVDRGRLGRNCRCTNYDARDSDKMRDIGGIKVTD